VSIFDYAGNRHNFQKIIPTGLRPETWRQGFCRIAIKNCSAKLIPAAKTASQINDEHDEQNQPKPTATDCRPTEIKSAAAKQKE